MSEWEMWVEAQKMPPEFDCPPWLEKDPRRPWLRHGGGGSPVSGHVMVEILTSKEVQGRTYIYTKHRADALTWEDHMREREGRKGRIVAWRRHERVG